MSIKGSKNVSTVKTLKADVNRLQQEEQALIENVKEIFWKFNSAIQNRRKVKKRLPAGIILVGNSIENLLASDDIKRIDNHILFYEENKSDIAIIYVSFLNTKDGKKYQSGYFISALSELYHCISLSSVQKTLKGLVRYAKAAREEDKLDYEYDEAKGKWELFTENKQYAEYQANGGKLPRSEYPFNYSVIEGLCCGLWDEAEMNRQKAKADKALRKVEKYTNKIKEEVKDAA